MALRSRITPACAGQRHRPPKPIDGTWDMTANKIYNCGMPDDRSMSYLSRIFLAWIARSTAEARPQTGREHGSDAANSPVEADSPAAKAPANLGSYSPLGRIYRDDLRRRSSVGEKKYPARSQRRCPGNAPELDTGCGLRVAVCARESCVTHIIRCKAA